MLRDLRDTGDSVRWTAFERAYRPFMRRLLSAMSKTRPDLTTDMYDDVIQETLIVLMKKFPAFVYDRDAGSFRGYLRVIVENKAKAVMAGQWRRGKIVYDSAAADGAAAVLADAGEADDVVTERLEMAREIWTLLLRRVFASGKYSGETQEIFRQLMSGQRTVDALAEQYGKKRNAIYQLKSRIMEDLRSRREVVEHGSGDLFDLLEKLLKEEAENE